MATRHLIGLDIGSKYVRAVEIACNKKAIAICNVRQEEVPDQNSLRDVLSNIFTTTKFKTKRVVTAVSGRSVIVRYITMPIMSVEELNNAIKMEASKYIPFEIQDVVLDCQKLQQGGSVEGGSTGLSENEMRVLLVAVKKNVIEEHIALLEALGLTPDIIDVDAFALGNAFELRSIMNTTPESQNKVIALVDIGASKTNINILDNTTSQFTREIYMAGNDFTDAISKKLGIDLAQAEAIKKDPGGKAEELKEAISGIIDDLCHEIRLSFDYFENQFDKPIEQLYFSGGAVYMAGLQDLFERALEKKPLIWNPTEFIPVESEDINPEELKHHAPQLAIAVGLASRVRKD